MQKKSLKWAIFLWLSFCCWLFLGGWSRDGLVLGSSCSALDHHGTISYPSPIPIPDTAEGSVVNSPAAAKKEGETGVPP